MEQPCLNDEAQYPDDKILKHHLLDAMNAWDAFTAFLDAKHPNYSREWRYYKDGKSWLCKVSKKSKTICWVSIYPGKFKTTFYFPDRAETLIVNSTLRKKTIEQFVHGTHYGRTRGLTVDIRKVADLSTTKKLIAIKDGFK